jgi:hypothetical protein
LTTQGSGVWHFPQRGTPRATDGTRFLVWHFEHTTICLAKFAESALMLLPSPLADCLPLDKRGAAHPP